MGVASGQDATGGGAPDVVQVGAAAAVRAAGRTAGADRRGRSADAGVRVAGVDRHGHGRLQSQRPAPLAARSAAVTGHARRPQTFG